MTEVRGSQGDKAKLHLNCYIMYAEAVVNSPSPVHPFNENLKMTNFEIACDAAIASVAPLYNVAMKDVWAADSSTEGKKYVTSVGNVTFACVADHKTAPEIVNVCVEVGGHRVATYETELPVMLGRGSQAPARILRVFNH